MKDLPPRKRGRPTKEEVAAREQAAQEAQAKQDKEGAFLDDKLAAPIKRRKTKLQPEDDTLRTISELAKLFCTQEEIAAVLGVTSRTLINFLNEYPEAREAWEDGMQHAKISLRRKQLGLADRNAPAAIFLGKNYLGQKDESTTNLNVTKDVKKMSETELLEIAARGAGKRSDTKEETKH